MKSESAETMTKPELRVTRALKSDMRFRPGRRAEIKYRDLGVKDATAGRMRAEVMHADVENTSRPTGWHHHVCDIQFLYMIKGWVDMEFADIGTIRIEEGDSIMIPGGLVHQELRSSGPMELLEISLPADLGTVNCEAPPGRVKAVESNAG